MYMCVCMCMSTSDFFLGVHGVQLIGTGQYPERFFHLFSFLGPKRTSCGVFFSGKAPKSVLTLKMDILGAR